MARDKQTVRTSLRRPRVSKQRATTCALRGFWEDLDPQSEPDVRRHVDCARRTSENTYWGLCLMRFQALFGLFCDKTSPI